MYQKQNFVKGQKLTAEQMNHIEDGIYNATGFYTELSRAKSAVNVHCRGLTAGETYAVHLYTLARRRGYQQNLWRHPDNEKKEQGSNHKGYARLSGQSYKSQPSLGIVYPDVPEWMPRGGILQTEWEFTATGENGTIQIDLREWLLDLLKPAGENMDMEQADLCSYNLIGVSGDDAPLLMQFRPVKGSLVGECKNILAVGVRVEQGIILDDPVAPRIPSDSLFTSIR